MQRTGAMLLGAALLAAGCVDGDAPRTAATVAVDPSAQQARRPQQASAAPDADEPSRAVPELARAMIDDPDSAQRRESVYALADAEGADHAAIIGQALTDPDPSVRTAAVEAMTGIDDGTAADWLSLGLGDPEPRVRRAAVEALGQVGGDSARFLLQQALGDADAGVREAAEQMLSEPEFAGSVVR